MVSKRKLLEDISELKIKINELIEVVNRVKELEVGNERVINSLKAINSKLNKHLKEEKKEEAEDKKIQDWLGDSRIDEVQEYLHKGVK